MGKATGFLEIERKDRTYEAPEARVQNFREFVIPLSEDTLRNQLPVAWIAACPIAIMVAPSTTRSPTGTIWSMKMTGRPHWQICIRQIISPNLPDASARHRAKRPAR